MDARRILAVGSGVGIEILGEDLRVTGVRVRFGGVQALGSALLAGFRQRPAAAWGAEYDALVRRWGVSHLAATVLLPRAEVIVRPVALPGVPDSDLEAAIGFQADSLHPYGEDEVRIAWARLPETPVVLVAIARTALVEQYAQRFAEAGIKVASFTVSAAAIYSALRLPGVSLPEAFLALHSNGALEAYGESPARPLFSALLEFPPERAVPLAAAELRLPPETEPVSLAAVLPQPKAAPPEFDLPAAALCYGTALASACPRLGLAVNLLPPELRSASSRAVYVPTVALAVVLAGLAVALASQGAIQERRQLALLREETARFEDRARKSEQVEQAIEQAQRRIRLLDGFRGRSREDLEVLAELTRLIEPPAWLNSVEITRDAVIISGEAEQAAPLLQRLDSSPRFRNSEFVGAIGRRDKLESFRIRMAREGVAP